MGGTNFALVWTLLLVHDARVWFTDCALGLPHLLQVTDGLTEGLDDARPRVRAGISLHLLHCARMWCANLTITEWLVLHFTLYLAIRVVLLVSSSADPAVAI